jgi:hypothetical protein
LTNGHVVGLGEKSAFPTNGFPPVEGDLLKNGIFGKLGWLVTSGWDFTENPTLRHLSEPVYRTLGFAFFNWGECAP